MTDQAKSEGQTPVVVITFDDDYATKLIGELDALCPIVHVSPLMKTVTETIEGLQPSVILLDVQTITTEGQSIFETMEQIGHEHPDIRKIAIGYQNQPAQLIAAMKSGACDFLDRNASPQEVREAITRQFHLARAVRGERKGRVVALASGRENDGELDLAVNLAAYLAVHRAEADVLLLDYNLENSRFEIDFDVEATYTVQDAIGELLTLDKSVLAEVLAKHQCGLSLLPLVTGDKQDEAISPQELATLLSTLRALFSIVIVNAGCLRHASCQPLLLPLLDEVVVLCSQHIASIKSARSLIGENISTEYPDTRFSCVVTKYMPAINLPAEQIAGRLGLPLIGLVREDHKRLANAHNLGTPLVLEDPHCAYSKSVAKLAEQLVPAMEMAPREVLPVPGLHNLSGVFSARKTGT